MVYEKFMLPWTLDLWDASDILQGALNPALLGISGQ